MDWIEKKNEGAYVDGEPYIMFNNPDKYKCSNRLFYDTPYLYGYYCAISGNKCDYNGYEGLCPPFDKKENNN